MFLEDKEEEIKKNLDDAGVSYSFVSVEKDEDGYMVLVCYPYSRLFKDTFDMIIEIVEETLDISIDDWEISPSCDNDKNKVEICISLFWNKKER